MRLIKRLIELAFFVFLLSLFGKNMDLSLQIKYYGLPQPITVQFWELVIFCVAFGIIIAALGDFITQLKWLTEKRRMIKTDREHHTEVQTLSDKIRGLEAENLRIQKELDQKTKDFEESSAQLQQMSRELETKSQELALAKAKEPADAEDPFAKALSDPTERDERA